MENQNTEKQTDKEKIVWGTFFVYFNFADKTSEPKLGYFYESITEEYLSSILEKYYPQGSVSKTYNFPKGGHKGFVWMTTLTAKEGDEEIAKHNFARVAYQVALEVGLSVDGPYCNAGWYEQD
jgi:hypothetical protein